MTTALVQSAFKSTKWSFLCFLLVTMLCVHDKVFLNAFLGKGWKLSHSMSGAGLTCLTVCLHQGDGKMQHSSTYTEMGKGPFRTLNFDWLEELIWDTQTGLKGVSWSYRGGGREFLQPSIGAPLWWLKETVHFGYLGLGKVKGLCEPLINL